MSLETEETMKRQGRRAVMFASSEDSEVEDVELRRHDKGNELDAKRARLNIQGRCPENRRGRRGEVKLHLQPSASRSRCQRGRSASRSVSKENRQKRRSRLNSKVKQ